MYIISANDPNASAVTKVHVERKKLPEEFPETQAVIARVNALIEQRRAQAEAFRRATEFRLKQRELAKINPKERARLQTEHIKKMDEQRRLAKIEKK